MNIGEVFIALGFDVDQTKLKEFSDGVNGLQKQMIYLGASAAGAVFGLESFARGSIDNATIMENLKDATGENTTAMQKWATAASLANTQMSFSEALQGIKAVNKAVSDIYMGHGDANAFSLLGINYLGADGKAKTGTEIIQELATTWAAREKFFNQMSPGHGTQAHLDAIGRIGLGEGWQQALMEAESVRRAQMEQYQVAAAIYEKNKELGASIATLDTKWKEFKDNIVGKYAPDIVNVLDVIPDHVNNIVRGFDEIPEWIKVSGGVIAAGLALMFSPIFAAGSAAASILFLLDEMGSGNFSKDFQAGLGDINDEMQDLVGKSGVKKMILDFWNTGMDTRTDFQKYVDDPQGYTKQQGLSFNSTNHITINGNNDPKTTAELLPIAITKANRETLMQVNLGGQ